MARSSALDGIARALSVALLAGRIGGVGAGPLGGVVDGVGVLAVGPLIALVIAIDSAIGGAVGSLFSRVDRHAPGIQATDTKRRRVSVPIESRGVLLRAVAP